MRAAFTLVELVIVLLIAALLSSIALVSLGGTVDRYRLARGVEVIQQFDQRARRDARITRNSVVASIDGTAGRISIASPNGNETTKLELPSRIQIGSVRVLGQRRIGRQCNLVIDARGRGPTYAVELKRGSMTRWVMILGQSGQTITTADVDRVDALFSTTR